MPIRPENKARYPKEWQTIRASILQRAGDKCEFCGVPNHSLIVREEGDTWRIVEGMEAEVAALDGKRVTYIVLTIAHLDHTPENCDPDNLRALCQRCHNRYDARTRAAGIAARRAEAAGQTCFDCAISTKTHPKDSDIAS